MTQTNILWYGYKPWIDKQIELCVPPDTLL